MDPVHLFLRVVVIRERNPSGVAADLYSSYYASNQPLVGGLSGTRWFWTNSLGTVSVSFADDFDAEDVGNAAPGVGEALQ